jgi:hypothetical protein
VLADVGARAWLRERLGPWRSCCLLEAQLADPRGFFETRRFEVRRRGGARPSPSSSAQDRGKQDAAAAVGRDFSAIALSLPPPAVGGDDCALEPRDALEAVAPRADVPLRAEASERAALEEALRAIASGCWRPIIHRDRGLATELSKAPRGVHGVAEHVYSFLLMLPISPATGVARS